MLLATSGPCGAAPADDADGAGAPGAPEGGAPLRAPHAATAPSPIIRPTTPAKRSRACTTWFYHSALGARAWRFAPSGAASVAMAREQPLGGERGLHGRPIGDPVLVVVDVGIELEVDPEPRAPLQHHEQVRIGDREGLAHQECAVVEHVLQVEQPPADLAAQVLAVRRGRLGLEQRAELLVELGRDEVEPFLQVVAS